MKRYHPVTNELFLPHLYGDGFYRVADPRYGNVKHKSKNQIPVKSEQELLDCVRKGFHVRMKGQEQGQVNLIKPEEIVLDVAGAAPTKANRPTPKATSARSSAGSEGGQSDAVPVPRALARDGVLPPHGRIACQRCFSCRAVTWGETVEERSGWRLVNNPMAWGSQTPTVLVLGFSKGGNQNADILARSHDEVAFRGGRQKLETILSTLGLISEDQSIDRLIANPSGQFAFGSLVRCSVKKKSGDEWLMSGSHIMKSCLRDHDMGEIVRNCASEFLGHLPDKTRLIVMLGNDLDYVEGCFQSIKSARRSLRRINDVAYRDEQVTFVHTVHFKAQGNLVERWATGAPGDAARPETDQPHKRELARAAIAQSAIRL